MDLIYHTLYQILQIKQQLAYVFVSKKYTTRQINIKKWGKQSKSYSVIDISGGFAGGSVVKNPPANAQDVGLIPGWGRTLEKEMATHSSILAWEIPWTEEPDYSSCGCKESDTTQ